MKLLYNYKLFINIIQWHYLNKYTMFKHILYILCLQLYLLNLLVLLNFTPLLGKVNLLRHWYYKYIYSINKLSFQELFIYSQYYNNLY